MKKIVKAILIVVSLLLLSTVFICSESKSHVPVMSNSPSGSNLSFSVLGDIHDNDKKLQDAIKDLYSINASMDAMVLNGDVVDQGVEVQYNNINKCLKRNKRYLPVNIIKNMGNHEFFDYAKGVNNPSDVSMFIKRYLDFSGEKEVYHDRWIKSYHFISLGSEKTYTADVNSVEAFISKKQQDWLNNKIKENYEIGKPIFVFLHQPLNLSNNKYRWEGVIQENEVRDILNRYPEVILFTSHIHVPLDGESAVIKKPFTAVHTGSVDRLLTFERGERKSVAGSQGLYVEVYKNRVLIRGRSFGSRSWIESAEFTVNFE